MGMVGMSGKRWCDWTRVLGRVACGAFFIALMLLAPAPARAVNPPIVVTNCNDSGRGSLRGAIGAATAGDTITFSANLNCTSAGTGPIILTTGTLTVDKTLTIDGTGATITVDGGCTTDTNGTCTAGGVTIFTVNSGVNATLTALTIQHGNTVGNGGGIFNLGTLRVTNSTFANNSVGRGDGGVIYNNSSPLTVTNSTFSGNNAGRGGGGIFTGGRATLTNTLVAASPNGGDLVAYSALGGAFIGTNNLIDDAASAGGFTDRAAGNIVGHPALLGTLGTYGGPT